MENLSICAIVKDENSYLPEWLEYHKLVGVEKFFIYDNGSRIPIRETLAADIASGTVIVHSFPGYARQTEAYMNCVLHCGRTSKWVAFIDVDEFLVPKGTDDFRTILKDFRAFGGLAINWQTFGSSGHLTRPPGLQTENFTMRGAVNFDWNRHIKTIARPSTVYSAPNCHHFLYKPGYCCVNERGGLVPGFFNIPPTAGRFQLNHYFNRSRAEFEEKVQRRAADGTQKKMEFFDLIEKDCNEVRDEEILRFIPALKKALEKREKGETA